MTNPAKIPEITPEELIETIETGKPIQVLDVRAPHHLASGHIDVLPDDRFFNVAGSQVIAMGDVGETGLDHGAPVAVVCARGNDSKTIAAFLNQHGFSATSVRGGMAAWTSAVVPRQLSPPSTLDHLIQFDRVGKGALGYLLVSGSEALIIDPPRNFQPFLDHADSVNASVIGVADTHVHADYISGAPELAESLGVPYHLHPADNSYPYDGTPGKLDISPLSEGSEISLGRTAITVQHNPGHTDGSVTFCTDADSAFTGDFVFVNSVGRPDLGGKVHEWTGNLWRSVERARKAWPTSCMIYPAHYASDAERRPDHSVAAPFGTILEKNEPMSIRDGDEFTAWILEKQTGFPEAYKKIKAVNVRILDVSAEEADVLEVGRNECALS